MPLDEEHNLQLLLDAPGILLGALGVSLLHLAFLFAAAGSAQVFCLLEVRVLGRAGYLLRHACIQALRIF